MGADRADKGGHRRIKKSSRLLTRLWSSSLPRPLWNITANMIPGKSKAGCLVRLLMFPIVFLQYTQHNSRTIVNEGAAASPIQPIVNLGQGFFGYNPPDFIINAAKEALDKVDSNQYSPTRGRPRLKKAIADAYSPLFGRTIDPATEVTITSGANEGRNDMEERRRSWTNW